MNETRESRALLEEWGHLPLAALPADVQARVAKCPACLAHFERTRQLVDLLRLKRHEQPDPAFEGRLLHRVSTRLQNTADLEPARARDAAAPEAGRWAWMGPFALAAALAVAFGVNQFTLRHPEGATVASTPAPAVAPAPAVSAAPAVAAKDTVQPSTGAPFSLTEQQVKDMFAVKPTISNDIDRIVTIAEQAGYKVVDPRQPPLLISPAPGSGPQALPVGNPAKKNPGE